LSFELSTLGIPLVAVGIAAVIGIVLALAAPQAGPHIRKRARSVALVFAVIAVVALTGSYAASRAQGQLPHRSILAQRDSSTATPTPRLIILETPALPPPSPAPAPTATFTVAPPTATPTGTSSPTATVTPSPTATASPTITPTSTPDKPRVVAGANVNLRSGPGLAYPVVATLRAGQEADILARNAAGDWWQLAWTGGKLVWVAAAVVRSLGPVNTVALAENIPPPPPTPTPRPTTPPTPSGPDFKLVSVRLWDAIENGGSFNGPVFNCGFGRVLRVFVIDAAGNRLNGVTVKSATIPYEEEVTGGKGPGLAEFVLGEAKEVYILRDADGREVTSDRSRGVTTMVYDMPVELLINGGYCKDATDCASFVAQCGCCHHYSWDVTFQRAY